MPPTIDSMPVKELLAVRKALGMKHRTGLASALGIAVSQIDAWENGKRSVPSNQAQAIRDLLAIQRRTEIEQASRMAGPMLAYSDFVRDAAAARTTTQAALFEMRHRSFWHDLPAIVGLLCFPGAVGCAYLTVSDLDGLPGFWMLAFGLGAFALLFIGLALCDAARRSCRVARLRPRAASSSAPASTAQCMMGPEAAMRIEPVLG